MNCLSLKQSAWRAGRILAFAVALIGLHTATARAQIASVDENGKRVYINVARPAPKEQPKPESKPSNDAKPDQKAAAAAKPADAKAMYGKATEAPQPVIVHTPARERLSVMVRETAERHQVDPRLVRAVVETESNWNPSAVSRKGAFGLMQLIPGTAQRMGVRNVFDPQQNLDGGVRYLRTLLDRYNGNVPLTLAAYNAGEGAVDRWRGVPNYRETRDYVRKVSNSYFQSGSDGSAAGLVQRTMRRIIDERGRVVYTNE